MRSSAFGRIITAGAIIMVAAFCGFVAGSIVGLQEFGRWDWWFPISLARVVRVRPRRWRQRRRRAFVPAPDCLVGHVF